MPTALFKTDITTASIGTTRGSSAIAWQYVFKTTDSAVTFGSIYDNANSFVDGATSTSKALMIVIATDAETVAIQDMDTLVIDGLTVWLPALSGDDTLYVDTDGNTWYDSALTSPAGGVSTVSDTLNMTEADFDGTDYFSESVTLSETFTFEETDNFSESLSLSDSISTGTEDFTIYLDDRINVTDILTYDTKDFTIYLNDRINLSDKVVDEFYGDFTEDSQTDYTWTEI